MLWTANFTHGDLSESGSSIAQQPSEWQLSPVPASHSSRPSDHEYEHLPTICGKPPSCSRQAATAPLLVFHPHGGLMNSIFGLVSTALLATALCRRFALAWGQGSNAQALASFSDLFRHPAGVAFLNLSAGASVLAAAGGLTLEPSSRRNPTGLHRGLDNCTIEADPRYLGKSTQRSLARLSDHRDFWLDGDRDADRRLLSACPVIHVRGNMYYVPLLQRNPRMAPAMRWMRARGLSCHNTDNKRPARSYSDDEPFFGAVSRHLLVPNSLLAGLADSALTYSPGVALIGIHVRSVLLLALHQTQQTSAKQSTARGVLKAYGFLDCIAMLRDSVARAAGYEASKVYVAADNPDVHSDALELLGPSVVLPRPAHVFPPNERPRHMTTRRGQLATGGALNEMLLLARMDGLIVWDLQDSTYSTAAASWATHRAAGQPLREESSRPWLGVHAVANGCKRVPDALIEPGLPIPNVAV